MQKRFLINGLAIAALTFVCACGPAEKKEEVKPVEQSAQIPPVEAPKADGEKTAQADMPQADAAQVQAQAEQPQTDATQPVAQNEAAAPVEAVQAEAKA